MRNIVERFVLVPFSMGCVSQSSTQVGNSHPRKSKSGSVPDVITSMISLPIYMLCECQFLYTCIKIWLVFGEYIKKDEKEQKRGHQE